MRSNKKIFISSINCLSVLLRENAKSAYCLIFGRHLLLKRKIFFLTIFIMVLAVNSFKLSINAQKCILEIFCFIHKFNYSSDWNRNRIKQLCFYTSTKNGECLLTVLSSCRMKKFNKYYYQ